jgi:hypothetical protein
MTSIARQRAFALAAALALLVMLPGCASTIADNLPTWAGGIPADTPDRSATPVAYPAVHDMPPPRQTETLTYDEQTRLEKDLADQRDRAAAAAAAAAQADQPASDPAAAKKAAAADTGTKRKP